MLPGSIFATELRPEWVEHAKTNLRTLDGMIAFKEKYGDEQPPAKRPRVQPDTSRTSVKPHPGCCATEWEVCQHDATQDYKSGRGYLLYRMILSSNPSTCHCVWIYASWTSLMFLWHQILRCTTTVFGSNLRTHLFRSRYDAVVANPPWGKRIGQGTDSSGVIVRSLLRQFPTAVHVIFCPSLAVSAQAIRAFACVVCVYCPVNPQMYTRI